MYELSDRSQERFKEGVGEGVGGLKEWYTCCSLWVRSTTHGRNWHVGMRWDNSSRVGYGGDRVRIVSVLRGSIADY